jgi:hypothetical protein
VGAVRRLRGRHGDDVGADRQGFANVAKAAVAMKSGTGGLVYFQNAHGEWRISEM